MANIESRNEKEETTYTISHLQEINFDSSIASERRELKISASAAQHGRGCKEAVSSKQTRSVNQQEGWSSESLLDLPVFGSNRAAASRLAAIALCH